NDSWTGGVAGVFLSRLSRHAGQPGRSSPNRIRLRMTDVRFAFRQLFKSPGFTLLAVLTLAVGIGLNTAIFTLINDLFLRRLPFQEPARLLHVFSRFKEQTVDFPLSAPRFMQFRDGQTIFDG